MERQAIEKIQEMSVAAAEVSKAELPVIALPNSTELKSLEPYMKNRFRFEALFQTEGIESFVEYVTKHDGEACYLDRDKMSALTIFDLGTKEEPGHCKHKARLVLEKTSVYMMALRVDGSRQGQKDIAELFEDYRDCLKFELSNGESMDVVKAITAVRNVTIESKAKSEHETHDFSASKSAMEQVEASSNTGELPARVILTCVPYNGLSEYKFTYRLSLLTSHSEPKLTLHMIRFEQLLDNMVEEFEEILGDKLPDSVADIFIGNIQV